MKEYNFTAKRGDTLNAIEFTMQRNSVAIDLTDCVITAIFALNNKIAFTLSTENNLLEITDAASGKFQITEQIITHAPGVYNFEIKFKFSDRTKTYIKGMLVIEPNITN
jgi:hypothetical protein